MINLIKSSLIPPIHTHTHTHTQTYEITIGKKSVPVQTWEQRDAFLNNVYNPTAKSADFKKKNIMCLCACFFSTESDFFF